MYEIVESAHGRYLRVREGRTERRYFESGALTVLNLSKPAGTNRTILHTANSPASRAAWAERNGQEK